MRAAFEIVYAFSSLSLSEALYDSWSVVDLNDYADYVSEKMESKGKKPRGKTYDINDPELWKGGSVQ